MSTEQLFTMFPCGCRLIIDPIFPAEGQYKVGYEYACYVRGEARRWRYLTLCTIWDNGSVYHTDMVMLRYFDNCAGDCLLRRHYAALNAPKQLVLLEVA